MELGLSLGKNLGFLNDKAADLDQTRGKAGANLEFLMTLGPNQDEEEDDDQVSAGDGDRSDDTPPLQLNLLPLALPWSSDNGSSENGSSAGKGLDVNRVPAAEEVSSAFHMYRNSAKVQQSGCKRDFGSDDDDAGVNARKKLRLSKEQSAFLEESFKEHSTLNPKQKLGLAKQLNLRPRQVEVWFQNRRARTKLKQTEVDCEYLKRCCETLTDENRRLHKEVAELRALKTSSNPFHVQLPATTLTMCPSCERVATASATAAPQKQLPFALSSRPRFYPFQQSPPAHRNQPAPS